MGGRSRSSLHPSRHLLGFALSEATCPGCLTAPPRAKCAACGAPAVEAVVTGAHTLSLCRRCAATCAALRAEQSRWPPGRLEAPDFVGRLSKPQTH